MRRRPEEIAKYLEPDQARVYQLIWQRFVASQMTPVVYDMTIVDFELGPGGKYLVRATGSVIDVRRIPRALHRGTGGGGREDDGRPDADPAARGRRYGWTSARSRRTSTSPSRRPGFREASLVKELERLGIGRPSTYSAIVSHAQLARLREGARAAASSRPSLGETVEQMMVAQFPDIFNVEFTSEMETELDRIEEGELKWDVVLANFYGPFSKALDEVDTRRSC